MGTCALELGSTWCPVFAGLNSFEVKRGGISLVMVQIFRFQKPLVGPCLYLLINGICMYVLIFCGNLVPSVTIAFVGDQGFCGCRRCRYR